VGNLPEPSANSEREESSGEILNDTEAVRDGNASENGPNNMESETQNVSENAPNNMESETQNESENAPNNIESETQNEANPW
jgi:hypothetical protein